MPRRGRKPQGPKLVERLEGSERAKARLRVILETLAGRRTIPDACAVLGIHESMFHKLRLEVLQAALGRLEPRPLGRPPRSASLHDAHVLELEQELRDLRVELHASQIREELAEALPRLADPRPTPLKKTPPKTDKKRKTPRRRSKSRTKRPNP